MRPRRQADLKLAPLKYLNAFPGAVQKEHLDSPDSVNIDFLFVHMRTANSQPTLQHRESSRPIWISLLLVALAIALVTWFAPLERTLGERARLVYYHGAWVWAGKIAFAAAAISGLVGLLKHGATWQRYSQAFGYTGMVFWLTYLPLSLYVQQVNWGGIFWDEPRWRVPFMFGVAGLLLQIGLALIADLRITALANILFGAALWWFLGSIQNVLHPDSPIFQSDAVNIQIFFAVLLALSLVFGALLARLFYLHRPR